MTKVYPNVATAVESPSSLTAEKEVVTVWRKSLLFNCRGFTVFDGKGSLRFRVDSYGGGRKGEVVLMDAAGSSNLTIRRKRLSLGENWLIYEGDETVKPLYSVKKHMTLLHSKGLAHVTCGRRSFPSYIIEGSYSWRDCKIYDSLRRTVGEIQRKESVSGVALGGDVFRLVAHPELELAHAMAMVIVLEQMYGS